MRWIASTPRQYSPIGTTTTTAVDQPNEQPSPVSEWHIRVRHVKKILLNTLIMLLFGTILVQNFLSVSPDPLPIRTPPTTTPSPQPVPEPAPYPYECNCKFIEANLTIFEWLLSIIAGLGIIQALVYWVIDSFVVKDSPTMNVWSEVLPGVLVRRNGNIVGVFDCIVETLKFILLLISVSYTMHLAYQV